MQWSGSKCANNQSTERETKKKVICTVIISYVTLHVELRYNCSLTVQAHIGDNCWVQVKYEGTRLKTGR